MFKLNKECEGMKLGLLPALFRTSCNHRNKLSPPHFLHAFRHSFIHLLKGIEASVAAAYNWATPWHFQGCEEVQKQPIHPLRTETQMLRLSVCVGAYSRKGDKKRVWRWTAIMSKQEDYHSVTTITINHPTSRWESGWN